MKNGKILVGITHGDINGVGYEIILKLFSEPAMFDLCTPIVYGSPKVASYHRKAMELTTNFVTIASAEEAAEGLLNLVDCLNEDVKIDFGQPSAESGKAALDALERALDDYRKGLFDVLVTAPINKATIQSDQFHFPGHTEYIQERVGEGREALMILMNDVLRVAFVTTHLPIREVAQAITKEAVMRKVRILHEALRRDFNVSKPRIAVLALNPHAGDDGLLGTEEKEIISPAIQELEKEDIICCGPYAADGFFGNRTYEYFDGILAMYHDQGLAPFKALAMENGVNFTAGLPIIRTSPDHGTAYDIAGQGKADASSMRQAVYTALDVFRNRKRDEEAHANPLRSLYHDRRDDSDKLKLNSPDE
ncbi:MAG: 4-hydroxythreonine-4-phosphate dehydrogenase PdxA [Paraprevotella sp.]|nr:4-hydroxythreonine-4-phosphate dehydrogenase PdxA [Paraprevotella sp.]